MEGGAKPASASPSTAASSPIKPHVASGLRTERREPMSLLRRRVAERLVHAQETAAILTTFNEIDMSQVMKIRSDYKDKFKEKYGVGLGFMSFFMKAAVEALKSYPAVNGWIEGDEIVYHDYYDIGVAVSSNRGLVVPVVKDADKMSAAELEMAVADYGKRARDGKLTVDEMTGGTFTVSNGGVFGSLMSTPILNPPQSAILGMHKIQERPVVVNGEIVIRPMMYVALSYDHRIIDGRESVGFLVKIKESVEDPARLLVGV
jgi:2-oxoglutarate dehydrogenase E2 component (dihydrolipoamide succinyltransferase)